MPPRSHVAAILLGLSLLRCGGGSSSSTPTPPPPASGLSYKDPAAGDYQLKRNASLSSGSHLVLDLWGPAGATGSGVTATFSVDPNLAVWARPAAAASYVANGSVFNLGSGTPILKATVQGGTLVATVAEKGVAAPKSLNGPLLQVALDLKAGTAQGAAIALTSNAASTQVLLPDGSMPSITVQLGTLTAQ